ncbi:UNVERIFIED_CONTAM: hypothetical protein FKN15_029170 [Acipenser sinensis]
MINTLRSGYFSPYKDALLEAMFISAFCGFLPCGKITCWNQSFDPSSDLCIGDLHRQSQVTYSLLLKHSKSDREKKGVHVYLSKTHCIICPVSALFSYLSLRPMASNQDPLFLSPEGIVMSRNWFCDHLHWCLLRTGLPPDNYSGHSLRIGAATSAASRNIAPHLIKAMGRWTSSAYELYIQKNVPDLLSAQKMLCG